jgi:glutamine synthetase type III
LPSTHEVGMAAEGDLKKTTFLCQVGGFWRASSFPLTEVEKLKTIKPSAKMYALLLTSMRETKHLMYYIDRSCIANAFNDYRGLADKANCDLVSTWYKDDCKTLTFRASVETSTDIKDGDMCLVDYGADRLSDMMVYKNFEDDAKAARMNLSGNKRKIEK